MIKIVENKDKDFTSPETVHDDNIPLNKLRSRRKLIENKYESSSDSEDIPLKRLAIY